MSVHWIALIVFLAVLAGIIYALLKFKDEVEILGEFFQFLKEKKLWWITPIVLVLLLLGLVIVVFETGAISSVIYVLF